MWKTTLYKKNCKKKPVCKCFLSKTTLCWIPTFDSIFRGWPPTWAARDPLVSYFSFFIPTFNPSILTYVLLICYAFFSNYTQHHLDYLLKPHICCKQVQVTTKFRRKIKEPVTYKFKTLKFQFHFYCFFVSHLSV